MKRPTERFLLELARALRDAEHRNVAEHMMAGALWAMYPQWFDKSYVPTTDRYYQTRKSEAK